MERELFIQKTGIFKLHNTNIEKKLNGVYVFSQLHMKTHFLFSFKLKYILETDVCSHFFKKDKFIKILVEKILFLLLSISISN
jgi:hypothetical protein